MDQKYNFDKIPRTLHCRRTLACLITVQGRLLILGENSPKRRLFLLNKLLNKKRPGDPVLFSTRTLIPTTPVIRQARVNRYIIQEEVGRMSDFGLSGVGA